ncbi:MAG: phosphoribosylformylglycinamidine synthase II, partial [Acidobacteria bacterium]|nr:phosphoribosylformylglycinamidine synthase II [Acidobacteriota bacterium]
GNVSFYNETDGRGILPTPVIGMVGVVDDVRKLITQGFKAEGDIIALLGTTGDDLSVSEFAQTIAGLSFDEMGAKGRVPQLDLALEKQVQDACLKLADDGLIRSAHDCSDGGLAVALAEMCFSSLGRNAVGAELTLASNGLSNEALLFGESPSRIVISFSPENLEKVKASVGDIPFAVIGKVAGANLKINVDDSVAIDSPVAELGGLWKNSLAQELEG